jgi:hypothetical protein
MADMADSLRNHIGVTQPKRLDLGSERSHPESGLDDLTLVEAQLSIGAAVRDALKTTGTALKEVGDPSQVIRVCDGDIPKILARVWQSPKRRLAFIKSLAVRSGFFDEHVSLRQRKTGTER